MDPVLFHDLVLLLMVLGGFAAGTIVLLAAILVGRGFRATGSGGGIAADVVVDPGANGEAPPTKLEEA